MLNRGAKVGIVCCSNGQKREYAGKIERLGAVLRSVGLQPVLSDHIYVTKEGSSGTGRERAKALMDFYRDDRIKGIFDISGGDLANGVLPFLDYEVIANSDKTFWGYSDLTTVINAIYARTGKASVLYQIRNLIYEHGERQTAESYLSQLEQLGVFWKVSGILLGTFTEMQEKKYEPTIETLVRRYAGNDLPIAVTGQIGHGTDSKGIWIGKPKAAVAEYGS